MATFTASGRALIAKLMVEKKVLAIDKMIFAQLPEDQLALVNSDNTNASEPQAESTYPDTDYIVHTSDIYRASYVDADTLIYSVFLDSKVGFEFNYFGLLCSEYDTLIAFETTDLQKKIKTSGGVYGNNLTKNFVIKFSSAKTLTEITIPYESWQINFTDQVDELYLRTEQATEVNLGILSIATLDEIKAGESDKKAVTPKHLNPILKEFQSHRHTKNDIGLSHLSNLPLTHDASSSHQGQYASGEAVKQAYTKGKEGITEAQKVRAELQTHVPARALRADTASRADRASHADRAASAAHADRCHHATVTDHLSGPLNGRVFNGIAGATFKRIFYDFHGVTDVHLAKRSTQGVMVFLVLLCKGPVHGHREYRSDFLCCPTEMFFNFPSAIAISTSNTDLKYHSAGERLIIYNGGGWEIMSVYHLDIVP